MNNRVTHDRIEVRSEKVRRLLGAIPPSIGRWGVVVLVVVFALLVAGLMLVPYPYGNGESVLRHVMGM